MATLNSIKATQVMACPGSWALVAEAELLENGKTIYVTYQSYDTEEYTVSKSSVYDYLTGEDESVPDPVDEEYTSLSAAKKTKYGKTFAMLNRLVKKLGEEA